MLSRGFFLHCDRVCLSKRTVKSSFIIKVKWIPPVKGSHVDYLKRNGVRDLLVDSLANFLSPDALTCLQLHSCHFGLGRHSQEQVFICKASMPDGLTHGA